MNPVRRAVTSLLRLVGATCLLFAVLMGGLVAYHYYGRQQDFPLGLALGAAGLFAVGVLILLKSAAIAIKLTEDFEE